MAGFFSVIAFSFLSDRVRFRGPLMAANCAVAMAGYILLLAAESNGPRYAGTFLVAVGVFPNSALIMVSDTCIHIPDEAGTEANLAVRDGCRITWPRTTSGPPGSGS